MRTAAATDASTTMHPAMDDEREESLPALMRDQDGGRYWIRTSDLTDVNRAL